MTMAVKSVPLRIDMRGGTQIENVTKLVQDALAGAKLTVTYDGGKVKSIKDYGFRGPFGLQAIHRKFLDLREYQHWKR